MLAIRQATNHIASTKPNPTRLGHSEKFIASFTALHGVVPRREGSFVEHPLNHQLHPPCFPEIFPPHQLLLDVC